MSSDPVTLQEIEASIRNIPDFPQLGIQFKDITPVIGNPRLFAGIIDHLIEPYQPGEIDSIVGIDARGFIFAAAVALRLEAGFVPIRKKGKLPYTTYQETYQLEYGTNTIEIHTDALASGQKILLVDDLLATGGTAAAAANLLEQLGATIAEILFVIELDFLSGRKRFGDRSVRSLVHYA